jgi:hypothetical protein
MNMRQHKRAVLARFHYNNFWLWFDRRPAGPLVQAFREGAGMSFYVPPTTPAMMEHTLVIEGEHIRKHIEEAKREFVCQKVKDVIDTFDTREAALELVQKHARQKKAKLQVMDSLTGELVLFTEAELG